MSTDIRKPQNAQAAKQDDEELDQQSEDDFSHGKEHISIPIVSQEESDKTPLLGTFRMSDGRDKRIAIPVRIEPKVYFANERTFLSWIHFSIFLGGISSALVGLGNDKARISGFIFGAVSILFTIYALYLYRWRAARIRQRDPGPYDDLVGPTMVSGVFLMAMIANILFSFMENRVQP